MRPWTWPAAKCASSPPRTTRQRSTTSTPPGTHASAITRIFLIVDVDAHHYESESYNEVFTYIESPVIRRQAVESAKRGARASMLGGTIGYQDIGGRITRHEL